VGEGVAGASVGVGGAGVPPPGELVVL
jgi:hypothetical protein